MATLSIREYEHLVTGANGVGPMGLEPAIAVQSVAIGAGSNQSAAFNIRTRFVRLCPDAACGFHFGTNPTAIYVNGMMGAGGVEYFGVPQDGTFKVAVIQSS